MKFQRFTFTKVPKMIGSNTKDTVITGEQPKTRANKSNHKHIDQYQFNSADMIDRKNAYTSYPRSVSDVHKVKDRREIKK